MATNIESSSQKTAAILDQLLIDIAHADERLDEQIIKLKRQIALYERIYDLSSQEMQAAILAGNLAENHDICEWLFHLELLNHVAPSR